MNPFAGVGVVESIHHHLHDELVGNELAAVHVGARADPECGAILDMLSQDVAGGDLGDVVPLGQALGLRALPGTGWSEQHQAHGYFRKPS